MNDSKTRWIIALMLSSLLAACAGGRQATAPTEGVSTESPASSQALPNLLLEVDGEVELRRTGWTDYLPAEFGAVIRTGDLVRVAQGSQAAVFCGDEASWEQGPAVLAGDGQEHGVPCESGRPPRPWPDVAALRGAAEEGIAYVVQPRNTALLSDRPDLVARFSGASSDTLSIVTVLSDDGKERPPIQSTHDIAAWPEAWAPMEPGATYVLLVGEEQADAGATLGRGFWLLDPATAEAVRAQEARLRQAGLSEPAQHLLISELYRSYGLHAEAIDLLRPLSEEAPSPPVWLNLGQAYLETGLPAEASDSFEAALALAEKSGDLPSAGEAYIGLALVAQLHGEAAVFESTLEQARSMFEQVGDDERLQEIDRLTE